MFISQIALHNFRNYSQKIFEFSPGMTLIVGENGLGKSNLMESIYFVSTGHSPLCTRDKDMVKWNEKSFILRVEGESGADKSFHCQSVELNTRGQKKVKINQSESSRLADLMGYFGVVFFLPNDIEIVNGGPVIRRQFLDSLLCQFSPRYLDALRKYKRVLKQRNSVLKSAGRYSVKVKEVLTEQLVDYGSEVTYLRERFFKTFAENAKVFYEKISDKQGSFTAQYFSSVSSSGLEQDRFKKEFAQKLLQLSESESYQKTTLIGPHRDNLLLLLGERLASDFGSQGQKRLIALSLKLASAKILEDEFKSPPVLLLDDVFSDLDEEKRIRLSNLIQQKSQIILASARRNDIPFKPDKIIEIKPGFDTNDS